MKEFKFYDEDSITCLDCNLICCGKCEYCKCPYAPCEQVTKPFEKIKEIEND